MSLLQKIDKPSTKHKCGKNILSVCMHAHTHNYIAVGSIFHADFANADTVMDECPEPISHSGLAFLGNRNTCFDIFAMALIFCVKVLPYAY